MSLCFRSLKNRSKPCFVRSFSHPTSLFRKACGKTGGGVGVFPFFPAEIEPQPDRSESLPWKDFAPKGGNSLQAPAVRQTLADFETVWS
jgi:hypothetical protein